MNYCVTMTASKSVLSVFVRGLCERESDRGLRSKDGSVRGSSLGFVGGFCLWKKLLLRDVG